MKQKLILLTITMLLGTNLLATDNTSVDSLKQVLMGNINDSVRALVNSQIGYYLMYTDPDKSIKYYNIALDLCDKGDLVEIEALCFNALGVVYNVRYQKDSALLYYYKAIELYEKLHDTLSVAQIYNNMATTVSDNDEDVINYYQKALSIIRKYKDIETESYILFNLGRIYFINEDYSTALDYFYQVMEINVKINITNDPILTQAMGYCYLQFNMLEHSLTCFYKLLNDSKNSNNRYLEYDTYFALCHVYMVRAQYDSVAFFLQKIKLFANESFAKSFTELVDFSSYFLAVDSLNKAGKYIAMAEKELANSEDYNYKLIYWLNKSEYYRKLDCPQKSLKTLSVISIDSLKGTSYKYKLYEEYSKVYYQLGKTNEAYNNLQQAMQWKDSLNVENNRQLIVEKELTYNFEREKQELSALQKQESLETELELSQKKKLNLLLGTGMLSVLIITLIVYLNLRRKRKDNKLLLEQKRAIEKKEKLTANLLRELNHRVKNNLQMVSSLFTMQQYNTSDTKVQEALKKASGRIDSLAILHQHMYKSDYSITPCIKEYLTDLCEKIIIATNVEDKVKLQMNFEDAILNTGQLTHIGLITNELLTNAIKYGVDDRNDNRIAISFLKKDGKYILSVSNSIYKNGSAIANKNSSKFGLKLVQTIAQQYRGEVITNFKQNAKVEIILYFK